MAKKAAGPAKDKFIPCTLKQLDPKLLVKAAKTAVEVNPANVPLLRDVMAFVKRLAGDMDEEPPEPAPQHIALLTSKYWGAGGVKLGVYFMDTQDSALKNRILAHANAWGATANVQFGEASSGSAQVRIARQRGQGYYSYLGTDVLHIPKNQATMNLDSFSMSTPESEYRRVVRHEVGHTLGFPHEHMRREIVQRLDAQKTISYFGRTQGWSASEVRAQVLTPLEEAQITATPADVVSIMCYQLPASITTDGQPIPGGSDIDASDAGFCAKIYPKPDAPPPPPPPPPSGAVEIMVKQPGTYRLVS